MRKVLPVGIILLFIGVSVVSGYQIHSNLQPLNRGWLYVGGSGPGNYTSIQDAVDNATDGDMVFVYNGTYYEVLVVNKTIDLIGEDRNTTVIDGGWGTYVVDVSSDGVTISGFTIQNGVYSIRLVSSSNNTIMGNHATSNNYYGIVLEYSSNNIIMGNTASNNYYGIVLDSSSNNNIIMGNTASNNYYGIWLSYSSNNTVTGNTASNNGFSIFLAYSSNNNIMGNNASTNDFGIVLEYSSNNNTVIGNNASNNYAGIALYSCSNNLLYHNNLINNTQNADDDNSNTWDNGYPSGGNYWSDYNGTDNDGDGIGDTPYNIPGGSNQDRYPFMEPNGWESPGNQPPNSPTIDGPHCGKIHTEYVFSLGTITDPEGDQFYCLWDWGDGNTSGWLGSYESGQIIQAAHTWNEPGNYTIKVKLKDSYGAESNWSEPFPIYITSKVFLIGLFYHVVNQSDDCALFNIPIALLIKTKPISLKVYSSLQIIIMYDFQGVMTKRFIAGFMYAFPLLEKMTIPDL